MEATMNTDGLRALWHMLSERERKKALIGAARATGAVVLRAARREMMKTKVDKADRLRTNVRCNVFKERVGFKVCVSANPRFRRFMHTNRRGELKPLAYWFNSGTEERQTGRGGTGKRKPHSTGALRRYDFIANARTSIPEAQEIFSAKVFEWTARIAARHYK